MSKESPSFSSVLTAENGEVNVFWELIRKFRGTSNLTLAAIIKLIDEKLPLPDESWAVETTEKLIREFMVFTFFFQKCMRFLNRKQSYNHFFFGRNIWVTITQY